MRRRDEVLAASLDVLVDRGRRGFTHRAVDAAAGVPAGTTSNYFPSRRALLRGAGMHLAERNDDETRFAVPQPADEDELVHTLVSLVHRASGPRRVPTIGLRS